MTVARRKGKGITAKSTMVACRMVIVSGLVSVLVASVGWQLGKETKIRHAQGSKRANAPGDHQTGGGKAIAVTEGFSEFTKDLDVIPVDYFPSLLEAIETLPEDNGYLLARLVWKAWGRRDPPSLMDYPSAREYWAVRVMLDGWAEHDFDGAWKAAKECWFGDAWKRTTIEALMASNPICGRNCSKAT